MKKLVFMFVAMAAISFAACGGNKANEAAPVEEEVLVDEVAEPVDSVVTDSMATDTTAVVAETAEVTE